jgi:hypothetical protein
MRRMESLSQSQANLIQGILELEAILFPHRFHFEFREERKGSDGHFAWGEFVKDERRLELHFRQNLGLVRYHAAQASASHDSYMRALAKWELCRYPGFSGDPIVTLQNLAHDLGFVEGFLCGSANVVHLAAAGEAEPEAVRSKQRTALYADDRQTLGTMQNCF